jgi:hypothetical protein
MIVTTVFANVPPDRNPEPMIAAYLMKAGMLHADNKLASSNRAVRKMTALFLSTIIMSDAIMAQ